MSRKLNNRAGFTLVELLLSMVISVMVFSAMGVLLVKMLRLWGEGAGQFHLASSARSARARLMSGGIIPDLGPGTGLLSISEVTSIKTNSNWCTLEYQAATLDNKFWIQGSVDNTAPADKSVFIKASKGEGQTWLTMVGIKRGQQNLPDVTAMTFDVVHGDKTLIVSYILSLEFGGKTYECPQIIRAYLVNE
jgi:prepilin-type N-terminal cleavage/methylation domain-containing protein